MYAGESSEEARSELPPISGSFSGLCPHQEAGRGFSCALPITIPGSPVGEVRQKSDKNCHRSDHGTLGIVRRPVWM